ncbi:50S ribosomal protein L35 [bacterium]|nr:50S ribosomal protein L35 [bacterium]NIN93275.1 50S ribosomal protein L35 [bacterium]NIO19070.1 50S ribosomal protein L35 [bacterium]NIO74201.1 50S ribosomal protein L35 [bacterium]
MPKIKTHSGVKKRFKFTAKGKIKHKRVGARHKLTKKSPKRLRKLRKSSTSIHRDKRLVKKLLPYG